MVDGRLLQCRRVMAQGREEGESQVTVSYGERERARKWKVEGELIGDAAVMGEGERSEGEKPSQSCASFRFLKIERRGAEGRRMRGMDSIS